MQVTAVDSPRGYFLVPKMALGKFFFNEVSYLSRTIPLMLTFPSFYPTLVSRRTFLGEDTLDLAASIPGVCS